MENLTSQTCEPCRIGAPTVTEEELAALMPQVPGWAVIEDEGVKKLMRRFDFDNFVEVLAFTNKIGDIAEQNGHHPVILLEYSNVTIWWWTHKIDGLHENDFIMAAKSNECQTNS